MTDRTVRVLVVAELPGYDAAMQRAAAGNVLVGDTAVTAGRGIAAMGVEADASRAGLTALSTGARSGGVALAEMDAAAATTGRGLRTASVEATAAGASMRRAGVEAEGGLARMSEGGSRAFESFKGLGELLAGGAIIFGIAKIVEKGNEYNDAMQKYQEVTRASGAQMASAAREAQALGADIKLPSASAAEAASAMVDLAKAGLSAQDAITAARGTIQLAAAARTDVATAAQIEGDIMDQFALKSSEASRVADVLANTSNSASGGLMDIYYAMKYVGPIAHSAGVSVQDTATAIGLLGKSGIIGETAGTALRSALVNMSKPTTAAKKGLSELGIQAYTSSGQFKGLQYVVTQLGDAQKRMNTQQFLSAAAMAFGKPALAGMVALAHQGGDAWNTYALQVNRAGGAAALAAAESKGLGGAMRTMGKELSAAFLQVYLGISPVLEKVTRGLSSGISSAIPYVQRGIKDIGDLWTIYGPTVEKKLASASSAIEKEAVSWLPPIEAGLVGLGQNAVPLVVSSVGGLVTVFHNAEAGAVPLTHGLHDMFTSITSSAGALGAFSGRLQIGVGALGSMSRILGPIGSLVGGLAHAFSTLPGPMQLSVLAMIAMRPFRPQIQSMQTAVAGYGRSAVASLGAVRGEMSMQAILAQRAGVSLGRMGLAYSVIESHSQGLQAMGGAFRGVTSQIDPAASGLTRFGGAVRGIGAAAGVGALRGLKSAASGLLGVMGGPWGLAIGAGMMALDYFSQKSAAAKQAITSMTGALQQDSGAIGTNTQALIAQKLQQSNAFEIAKKYGIQQGVLQQAAEGQSGAVAQVNALLAKNATYMYEGRAAMNGSGQAQVRYQADAQSLKDLLGNTNSVLGKSRSAYQDQQAAIAGAAAATSAATNPTGQLQNAVATLANSESDADTKAQALHRALQLLSGGELDVQAAVATMNQSVLDLNSSWKDGVDKANGFGKALLQQDGSLNTTSANGQTLWTKLQDLNTQTAATSQATLDYALASGKTLPDALKLAEGAMQTSWTAAVTAGEKFGLTADQAKMLAASMGFIPSSLAITMSTPGMDATQKGLLYVQGLANHLPAGKTITVSALTAQAQKAIEQAGFKVKQMPGGRQIQITAPTAKAQANLNAIINKLYSIQSKTVDVTVAYKTVGGGPAKASLNADGAIRDGRGIKRFAAGGEDHSAQIAPGGAMRLWAEPETGGEAYIPLGDAKRKRSKELLEEVARQFGGAVHWFADGGLVRRFASGGFNYTPGVPALGGVSDPMARYTAAIAALQAAWDKYNAAIKTQAKAVAAVAAAEQSQAAVRRKASASVTAAEQSQDAVRKRTSASVISAEQNQSAVRRREAASVSAAEQNLSRVRSGKHTNSQLVSAENRLTAARNAAAAADDSAARRTTAARASQAAGDVAAARKTAAAKTAAAAADAAAAKKTAAAKATAAADAKATAADAAARNAADATAGLWKGAGVPGGLNLAVYEKQLSDSLAATQSWRSQLSVIGARGGSEVESILQGMGQDGAALTAALATASAKDFATITANLQKVSDAAKATLADFDTQVAASAKTNAQFSADLTSLASRGYGTLAQQLAGQGDQAAMDLAREAATASSSQLAQINKDVTAQANTLSGTDLQNALLVITSLRSKSGEGIADVIAAGISASDLLTLMPKILPEVQSLPDAYKATFLKQWAGQTGGTVAMASGGILADGSYTVLAGERGTGGEAYIPLGQSNRPRSTAILAEAAARMGYQLMPAGRFMTASGGGSSGPMQVTHHKTVHLHGAKQDAATQAADVLRHMVALG